MGIDRVTGARSHIVAGAAATALALVLSACGQENRYVAPPPPKVTVAVPAKQKVTRYLEATGYSAIWSRGYRDSCRKSIIRTVTR